MSKPSDASPRTLRELVHNWYRMPLAPRDGTIIRVAVAGRRDELGWDWHELPYPVRFHEGRWCYARHNTPLFDGHNPVRWRPRS